MLFVNKTLINLSGMRIRDSSSLGVSFNQRQASANKRCSAIAQLEVCLPVPQHLTMSAEQMLKYIGSTYCMFITLLGGE